MTMLIDDKSWVARQLNLGKRVAWIEQERQIPRDEIVALGEQLGLHLDAEKDTMTARPTGLDRAPETAPPPQRVDPARFTVPTRPAFVPSLDVEAGAGHSSDAAMPSTPDVDGPQQVWVCPVCDQEESLGERFHFRHRDGYNDDELSKVRNVAVIGHPSAGVTTVEEAVEHVTEQIDDLAGSYGVVLPADTVEGPPSTTVQVMGSTPERAAAELIVADGVIVKARGQLTDLARQLAREIGANGMLIDVATARYLDAKAELERVKAVEDGLVADLLAEIRAPEGPPEQRATRAQAATAAAQTADYTTRLAATGRTAAEIRLWALSENIECGAGGRLPLRVLDAYELAHAPVGQH